MTGMLLIQKMQCNESQCNCQCIYCGKVNFQWKWWTAYTNLSRAEKLHRFFPDRPLQQNWQLVRLYCQGPQWRGAWGTRSLKFFEVALCHGFFPKNLLLSHFPGHPKPFLESLTSRILLGVLTLAWQLDQFATTVCSTFWINVIDPTEVMYAFHKRWFAEKKSVQSDDLLKKRNFDNIFFVNFQAVRLHVY